MKILGMEKAEELERLITPYGGDARNIAELGIGTNEMAIISGNILGGGRRGCNEEGRAGGLVASRIRGAKKSDG